ncbi:hypothetical protein Leryth_017305 [Lithospermum erythrorhizon]|nr:hypothetical protein Leryth_017305 [Lithospermum erythrorhizon]
MASLNYDTLGATNFLAWRHTDTRQWRLISGGDLVALIDVVAPDERKVFVVGHDWGAMIAWALCLCRPDKVKALVNMSVVFSLRNPKNKPTEALHAVYGDEYYISRFQKPGEIEAVFAQTGTRTVFEKFFTYRNPGPLYLPKGKEFEDVKPQSTRLKLGTYCTMDWSSNKSASEVHRRRP